MDRANASIKGINKGLSSFEQAARNAARGASQGIDGFTVSVAEGAAAGAVLASAFFALDADLLDPAEELRHDRAREAQLQLNEVLAQGVKIHGAYEAAMETAGKQMTSLTRYWQEARNAVGGEFMPEMRKVIAGLTELAKWTRENADAIAWRARALVDVAVGATTRARAASVAGRAARCWPAAAFSRWKVFGVAAGPEWG